MRPPAVRLLLVFPVLVLVATAGRAADPSLFPFVLPWDDASPGLTDLSGRLEKPAGQHGHITAGEDGHLYLGDQRVRLFGVDITFSAALPTHAQAEAVAGRLAKFGFNHLRIHIVDSRRFPDGLLLRDGVDTRHLDPEGLDRLDYFVAQLKAHGLYVDLNLLNYRPISAADGLPAEIDGITGSTNQPRHALGFFDEGVLNLQKEYARQLLTHVNVYTGKAYVAEPAISFVEINNENGLLHAWLRGWLEDLPPVFARELQTQWNAWLKQRYGTDARLRQGWQVGADPLGAELLAPGAAEEPQAWELQQNAGAEGSRVADGDVPPALRAEYPEARSLKLTAVRPGTGSWHLLLNRPGFGVQAGRTYTLSFWARADAACSLNFSLYQTAPPWAALGLQGSARLSTDWQRFEYTFTATEDYEHARVTFGDLIRHLGTCWVAGVSLRPGRPEGLEAGESLAAANLPCFTLGRGCARTPPAQADWRRFLWETEDRYWQTMYRYLKQDLGVQSLVIGTAVGCSTPVMMSGLDAVDAHAYWEHPRFPGRPWDANNWVISQRSMVNERGGIIADLAMRRVLGKPRVITEYCHPAPNGYGVEGYLLLAAYAALQDWDCLSVSRYAQKNDFDLQRLRGYFDIDQDPAKMASLVAASSLFTRADVRPAREQVVVTLDEDREVDLLGKSRSWQLVDASLCGVAPETALVHRVGIAVRRGAGAKAMADARPPAAVPPGPARFVSDTGELTWDLTTPGRGVVTVNTPASKAVIGWGAGRRFTLGGVMVEPGETLQQGWSALTLTALTGSLDAGPARLLVTASGLVENTNMGWKNPEHTTVGRDWGQAPTLVEGIPARLVLPAPAARVQAWALDERGQRREPVPVAAEGADHAALSLGPRWRTLWYEVQVR